MFANVLRPGKFCTRYDQRRDSSDCRNPQVSFENGTAAGSSTRPQPTKEALNVRGGRAATADQSAPLFERISYNLANI